MRIRASTLVALALGLAALPAAGRAGEYADGAPPLPATAPSAQVSAPLAAPVQSSAQATTFQTVAVPQPVPQTIQIQVVQQQAQAAPIVREAGCLGRMVAALGRKLERADYTTIRVPRQTVQYVVTPVAQNVTYAVPQTATVQTAQVQTYQVQTASPQTAAAPAPLYVVPRKHGFLHW